MMNEKKKTVRKDKVSDVKPEAPKSGVVDEQLLKVLAGISDGIGTLTTKMDGIDKRVRDIETGGKEKFKDSAKAEDILRGRESRIGVDEQLSKIVDELLGEDFGIKIAQFPDRPGFLFSLIVPPRLSDNVTDKRPKMDPENPAIYLKDSLGNVVFEDYMPEDRRSRAISSLASYDTIRQHCERVRAYIVSYFQKTQKPLPAFKVK